MIVVPVDEQRIDRATIELPRTGEPAEAAAYDDDLGSRRNAHSRSQWGGRSHPSLVTAPSSSMTRGYALASDSRNRATGRCVRAEEGFGRFPRMPEDRTVRRWRHSADRILTGRFSACPNSCKRDSSSNGWEDPNRPGHLRSIATMATRPRLTYRPVLDPPRLRLILAEAVYP